MNTYTNNNCEIPFNYYDTETFNMLLENLTDDDKEYIKNNTDEQTKNNMFKRWTTIINSLPYNYYKQYYLQTNPQDRNTWFKKYLDYPTKNILEMPELL